MSTDEPHKESTQGDHVWSPILEALKWQPYILSDPLPQKVGKMWHKKQIVAFPPSEAGSSFLDREFTARHEPIHIPPFTSPPENP